LKIKMINKKKKVISVFSILVLALSLVSFVSAVAVGGQYSTDNPLKMYPGEVKQTSFGLQNLAGTDDLKFQASVENGSELVSLIDDSTEYFLPTGTRDHLVNVEVKVPNDAEIGTTYDVRIRFTPIPLGAEEAGGTGAVLASGLSKYFTIEVVEKPEELEKGMSTTWIILGILAVVIVLVVVFLILKKKKAPKEPAEQEDKEEEPSE